MQYFFLFLLSMFSYFGSERMAGLMVLDCVCLYLLLISCASKCLSDARLEDVWETLHAEALQDTHDVQTQCECQVG